MSASFKKLEALLQDGTPVPDGWRLAAVVRGECLGYLAWNEASKEAIVVDPAREASAAWTELLKQHASLKVLMVIDTHTHADHVSLGANLAEALSVPYVMHRLSPSTKPHLKIHHDTEICSQAGKIRFIETPGHTTDGMAVFWGPFLFVGDTILYGDTGRDDLPGGDAVAHCRSLRKIARMVPDQTLVVPGHDSKGGRLSSWRTQLQLNASLTQSDADFIREASAFKAQEPLGMDDALAENTK